MASQAPVENSPDEIFPERYLSPYEVAYALNVSTFTVYKLIEKGDLPAIRIYRIFRIKESDLKDFLNSKSMVAGKAGT